jgi:hypothetical protein
LDKFCPDALIKLKAEKRPSMVIPRYNNGVEAPL